MPRVSLLLTLTLNLSFSLQIREKIFWTLKKYLVCVFCALHSIAWTKLKMLLPCRAVPFHAEYAWFGWKVELKFSFYFLYMIFHRDSTWSHFFLLCVGFFPFLYLARISWEISFSIYFSKSIFSSKQIVFFLSVQLLIGQMRIKCCRYKWMTILWIGKYSGYKYFVKLIAYHRLANGKSALLCC